MSHKLKANLNEIKIHIKKRIVKISALDKKSINFEYKEWINDKFNGNEKIWTLPDLTRVERFKNFCRSIKKEIK